VQITTYPMGDYCPSWSPDGSQIAFISHRSGEHKIWVIPAIGGTTRQITCDPGSDWHPSWSPDGNQIAFESYRSGNYDIWVMDPGEPSAASGSTWGRIKGMFE
jgi:Tol biopolymer transport system component